MKDPIAFIIPCLNRFDMFTETMETVDTPIIPYVIDNWRGNRGVSGAWNLGMERAMDDGHKYAVISNDDLKYHPGAIWGMYEAIRDTGAALVSPIQERRDKIPPARTGLQPGADFFCFIVDIDQIVGEAGWFDQNFFPAYFEDNDMHYRMGLAGLTSFINTDVRVIHEGSMTQKFDRNKPVTNDIAFESNRSYFAMKWGGRPQQEVYRTPFNIPGLSVREWNGSYLLDGMKDSEAQERLEEVPSVAYGVPMAYETA